MTLYFQGGDDGHEPKFLKKLGDLRNSIVHGTVRDYHYVAVPTGETLRRLSETYRQLMGTDITINRFPTAVEVVPPDQTLANVLDRIREMNFSQFPVYEETSDGTVFRGLLTENGIVRWLAHNIFLGSSNVKFKEITVERVLLDKTLVQELLKKQETKDNVMFVEDTLTVNEVRQHFSENNLLEAVLITRTGKPNEDLLAIATRWDVAGM